MPITAKFEKGKNNKNIMLHNLLTKKEKESRKTHWFDFNSDSET